GIISTISSFLSISRRTVMRLDLRPLFPFVDAQLRYSSILSGLTQRRRRLSSPCGVASPAFHYTFMIGIPSLHLLSVSENRFALMPRQPSNRGLTWHDFVLRSTSESSQFLRLRLRTGPKTFAQRIYQHHTPQSPPSGAQLKSAGDLNGKLNSWMNNLKRFIKSAVKPTDNIHIPQTRYPTVHGGARSGNSPSPVGPLLHFSAPSLPSPAPLPFPAPPFVEATFPTGHIPPSNTDFPVDQATGTPLVGSVWLTHGETLSLSAKHSSHLGDRLIKPKRYPLSTRSPLSSNSGSPIGPILKPNSELIHSGPPTSPTHIIPSHILTRPNESGPLLPNSHNKPRPQILTLTQQGRLLSPPSQLTETSTPPLL
ncbi:Unknown protein, partial [Striga hermonthica]